ncbi:hypothetical protein D781_3821 [Serratia sp. FGI94]|uniref:hypothetical protein n=1 Tax=Serratia sp. FGI94 TaxID=671990 RepID=UPI0002A6F7B4|nr:hypothetical protein [Serratia sp. FGI94]AGB84015.1 hypothetical protein D781_3821 [Serratia sp. FGI94]
MNGANGQLISSPKDFLEANVIDNINWLQEAGRPSDSVNNRLVTMANSLKEASFDLVRSGTGSGLNRYDFRLCTDRTDNDVPIRAYWCPFIQGNELPGYVDIPRHNPQYQFLFTPAMNGCAFYVTASPESKEMIRVYHNQHPDSELIKEKIGSEPISTFSFSEYGTESNPNAFNLMSYHNGEWNYISQPQQFTVGARGFGVEYRTGESVRMRPVF